MTKVYVRARSIAERDELAALVRSAPALELVAGDSGSNNPESEGEETEPDVILQRGLAEEFDEEDFAEEESPDSVPVLLIADEEEFETALSALRAEDSAVRGILPSWATDREIQIALEAVAAGLIVSHEEVVSRDEVSARDEVVTPEDVPAQLEVSSRPPLSSASSRALDFPGEMLSPREREVLNLLAAGLANKEIAPQLGISEHTVKFHVTSIFNKLGVSTRAEAVAVGVRRGFLAL